ncbi:NADP-specific glutamate dehydrogenase [Oceanobacillus indicireducens]|uniref:Glutamate dehydrogenase n=1 Tax=Oceanobacillus indicireducens TaxID=1004261 RepID=A0A917XRH9_9BACI|nr:NADP-specific glutamate dehydrogenase [Oceanobacillus indicireducens]GGN50588.1 glutamate dehydrogenase [Oceanobacillus indicireducens]
MNTISNQLDTENKKVSAYLDEIYRSVVKRDPNEPEFHQAVAVFLQSILPLLEKEPHYMDLGILEQIVEPERVISFRVTWVDDNGKTQVNRGYRVQFNSAIGPFKGGIRFDPSVNLSIVKFLGFEQTFKNSLTGQPIGGAKGGADFDPKGKSDNEIMRFCQSYMTELARYIGPDIDVPAGDLGVGAKEIGYMFGQYKRIRGAYEAGVITGKAPVYGGSLGRTEATGYGTIYFLKEMLRDIGHNISGSSVVVSGSGNVSIYAMEKASQLGAKVVACSDTSGYIYNKNGIVVEVLKRIKQVDKGRVSDYLEFDPDTTFHENCKGIWSVPCDVALPCATQNELDEEDAIELVKNGVIAVAEGANMPCTLKATNVFLENGVTFGPAKATNAGGVAVSQLEMAQNSMRLKWTFEEVDERLQDIMMNIYENCVDATEQFDSATNLIQGANIAGFKKVADAMIAQGVI